MVNSRTQFHHCFHPSYAGLFLALLRLRKRFVLLPAYQNRRNPYLDPLNHIQIALLKRYRAAPGSDERPSVWRDPLLRSINAIAGGMRNTG